MVAVMLMSRFSSSCQMMTPVKKIVDNEKILGESY
jgi:hypothetical protein